MPIGDLIVPAIIFAVIGFIVGALASYLALGRAEEPEEKAAPPQKPEQPAEMPAQDAKPPYKEPYTGLPLERFQPLARLYRENSTGKLVTEVDKKIYLNPDMISPEHLQKLREAAISWNAWLGLEEPILPVPAGEDLPLPEIPVSMPPFTSITADAAVNKPRATTVVGQIDEILQDMLKDTALANRGIRLVQDPGMGVVVWLDSEKYPGIDVVPDEEVKNLIRTAVKKWEETSRF